MTMPLVVLAIATVAAAGLGLPLVHWQPLERWIEPVIERNSPPPRWGS